MLQSSISIFQGEGFVEAMLLICCRMKLTIEITILLLNVLHYHGAVEKDFKLSESVTKLWAYELNKNALRPTSTQTSGANTFTSKHQSTYTLIRKPALLSLWRLNSLSHLLALWNCIYYPLSQSNSLKIIIACLQTNPGELVRSLDVGGRRGSSIDKIL